MYFTAAKFAIAVLVAHPGGWRGDVWGQLSSNETAVWRTLQPSLLILNQSGIVRGSAACIDRAGLYLAHQNSIKGNTIDGIALNGEIYSLKLLSRDVATGLVLLQITGKPAPDCPAIHVADEDYARKGTLLAVLESGPVRADIGNPNIVAVSSSTNQSVLVNEIRFDAPPQLLTGALLFDDRADLVGILGATLPRSSNTKFGNNVQQFAAGAGGGGGYGGGGFGGGGGVGGNSTSNSNSRQVGPSGLNVTYAVAPAVLSQVVTGFLSPTHEVQHPALGAVCEDNMTAGEARGAVIRRITPNSGAARAGLKVGDIILNIDGTDIHSAGDYARTMLTKQVGAVITLAIHRGDQTIAIDAVVGKVVNPRDLRQELSPVQPPAQNL